MREFDVFALPSLNEGISNTILEAMATGVAGGGCQRRGQPRTRRSGRYGQPCMTRTIRRAWQHAILRYANEPELRRVPWRGRPGSRREEFQPRIHGGGAIGNLYDELMNSRSVPRSPPVRRGRSSRACARAITMCGITGMFDTRSRRDFDRLLLQRMNDSQAHRGPDGEGLHLEPGVGLGHRRLVDHRRRHRPAAALQRGRLRCRRLQRRDLQLSGTDPGAAGARARTSIPAATRR